MLSKVKDFNKDANDSDEDETDGASEVQKNRWSYILACFITWILSLLY